MDNISRRDFTKLAVTAGAGLVISPNFNYWKIMSEKLYVDNMGIQLWTVGRLLGENQEKTLESLAELGFKHVELPMFTNVGSIASSLKKNGLIPTCRHFPLAFLTQDWSFYPQRKLPIPEDKSFESVVEDASKNGLKHLVMPNIFPQESGDLDRYKNIANLLNKGGEICQSAGIQLSYHNHNFEFIPIDDIKPFDIILEETDENLLTLQIDVFFLQLVDLDPAAYLKKLGSRVKLLHLKDLNRRVSGDNRLSLVNKDPGPELWNETVALGAGTIDFRSILTAAKEIKVEHCYIEVEGSQSDSVEVLEQSIGHLKTIGL